MTNLTRLAHDLTQAAAEILADIVTYEHGDVTRQDAVSHLVRQLKAGKRDEDIFSLVTEDHRRFTDDELIQAIDQPLWTRVLEGSPDGDAMARVAHVRTIEKGEWVNGHYLVTSGTAYALDGEWLPTETIVRFEELGAGQCGYIVGNY